MSIATQWRWWRRLLYPWPKPSRASRCLFSFINIGPSAFLVDPYFFMLPKVELWPMSFCKPVASFVWLARQQRLGGSTLCTPHDKPRHKHCFRRLWVYLWMEQQNGYRCYDIIPWIPPRQWLCRDGIAIFGLEICFRRPCTKHIRQSSQWSSMITIEGRHDAYFG